METKATTGVGLYRDDATVPGDCPRCGSPLPVGYPGALSRADNTTEVCSACGQDEAMEGFLGGRQVTPTDQWPIKREFATDEVIEEQQRAMATLIDLKPRLDARKRSN